MSQYRAYPTYKDSGIEWIGQVPEEWLNRKVFHAFQAIGSGTTPPAKEHEWYQGGTIPWITTSELRENTVVKTKKCVTSDAMQKFSALKIFPAGSLAIAMYGATIGRLGFLGIPATTNQACCVLSGERDLNIQFLYYWLMAFRADIVAFFSEGGGQPNINQEVIASLRVPSPAPDEQATIVATLDRETARIDALIEKKTRFIELLKEKRQALITHAVTKGLDPNVKMKDSGVEWIGPVPEHWDVVPSTWLFVESKERAHEDDQHLSATQKYGVISLAEYERLEGRQVTHAVKNLEQRKHVKLDDFVISMRSFQGGIERVKALGCVRSSYVVIQAGDGADKNYFAYLFKSGSYIQGLQATSSFIRDGQDLNYGNFRQVRLPKPGSDEQMQIAKFLDKETARIDALARTTEQSITLLKERRAAFITAAVTGQIDLRGKQ
ncbi:MULTISPECIES: restriction endonuclease subunit S [Klebsiella pneumoniae complex]|uniref:restriction endonuclease subunit S n=1 Tax=Klebsiella quasipneumoniae TaxID=1463165 RepID=UPI002169F8B4|nr:MULTISPECIES: restriction endonuclease subunit S [Klebsiella]MCS4378343.1 restriction endonuclease subunit S [Klebsiella quasipneumoniae subsp. similipneumoniae]MCS4421416.1 restriction endonuclease subunit S [Klebsiella quasipneumoniae subsp. similipneumoniae]HBT5891969.1 restriction endonuclease subunit S [Klebsiella quasipneumoniae]HBV3333173.1 restriction endonuclease subunit S [Klebsiella pneumoniae]